MHLATNALLYTSLLSIFSLALSSIFHYSRPTSVNTLLIIVCPFPMSIFIPYYNTPVPENALFPFLYTIRPHVVGATSAHPSLSFYGPPLLRLCTWLTFGKLSPHSD